jgi:DNA-binding CsgD family transcriptional regulator
MRTSRLPQDIKPLTLRETQILTLTAQGKTRKEISVLLGLADETVKDYVRKILRKLKATNKANAVSISYELRLISPYRNNKQYPHKGD